MELWKDIPGLDGYQASNLGRIRALTRELINRNGIRRTFPGRLMSIYNNKEGYQLVHIANKNMSVHRLVLETFVGPRPDGYVCRHFPDRNPANNTLTNLQWGTPHENNMDMIFHRSHKHVLPPETVSLIYENKSNKTLVQYAEEYNVQITTIRTALRRYKAKLTPVE